MSGWLMLKACEKCAKMGARSCECQLYPPHVNADRAGYNPNTKMKPDNPSDLEAGKS